MLDWNRIHELQSDVGPDEFALILDLFLDEVEGVILRLARRNAAQLATDLHFLKGCARTLGFREFGDLCDQGESLTCNGRAADIDLDGLAICYSASKQGLFGGLKLVLGRRGDHLAPAPALKSGIRTGWGLG
ncbi:Hpt domain-containing protein [Paracoccus ravus]|uniref:Hpt domain-containing protein n=1 Tax=Paracoccus ravus TaxID=2447760 RepID=UPI00106EEA8B|nr:Hpt domain-containing protein [Paracoccus ravus]